MQRTSHTILVLICLVLIGSAAATALDVKVTNADNSCPGGYTLMSVAEARANQKAVCAMLGEWYIARLAGGGSMDGPGYDCKIRDSDTRSLGNSICVAGTPDYKRLTTQFRGDDMCLDIYNGGDRNNMPHLTECANYSGQFWRLDDEGNGWHRLTTQFRGDDMCLDIYNGGDRNNMPHLTKCANYSGQFWKLHGPDAGGWYRLTTQFRGDDMCLDIFNGGAYNNMPHLTKCANYSGQLWKIRDAG